MNHQLGCPALCPAAGSVPSALENRHKQNSTKLADSRDRDPCKRTESSLHLLVCSSRPYSKVGGSLGAAMAGVRRGAALVLCAALLLACSMQGTNLQYQPQ